jgi:antitoxin component of MazEF toxin-antitoxin module
MMEKEEEPTEYSLRRKLFKLGAGYAVAIPAWLAEAKDLHTGDTIKIKFDGYRGLLIEKAEKREEKG